MKNLVVIENATIDSLTVNAKAKEILPCLTSEKIPPPRRCCNGNAKNRQVTERYNRIKECILAVPPSTRRKLMELLDTRQLRVSVRRGKGTMTTTLKR